MIIDRARSAGADAYLHRPDDPTSVNLAAPAPVTARTPDLPDGVLHDVTGLRLVVEGPDLGGLLARTADRPLLSVTVAKEMFPGLVADPFGHRVHTVAGFDDLQRGTAVACRALDVEGIPTLVSLGAGAVSWTSPVYPLPAPVAFGAASWDLAGSRLGADNDYAYSLALSVWPDRDRTDEPPLTVPLAEAAGPAALRSVAGLADLLVSDGAPVPVGAFRIEFTATVTRDAALRVRHDRAGGPVLGESIGTPLLRGVHLLEPVPSCYDLASLSELLRHCSEYHLLDSPAGPATRLVALLDLPVRLTRTPEGSEYVQVAVLDGGLETVEVLVEATVHTRPPRA